MNNAEAVTLAFDPLEQIPGKPDVCRLQWWCHCSEEVSKNGNLSFFITQLPHQMCTQLGDALLKEHFDVDIHRPYS